MDFAYCKNDKKRYLLEINASPGTWYYQTDKKKLTIKMTSVDIRLPYIVDFCPMIRSREVFDKFISEIFDNYVCSQHNVTLNDDRVDLLRNSLIYLANNFLIYYTDPKASNVSFGLK